MCPATRLGLDKRNITHLKPNAERLSGEFYIVLIMYMIPLDSAGA